MTLQQLSYVIAISETGSLNRAAERLYVSQPTLTAAVKELEKELGIVLFNRGGRGTSLTAEGLAFLPYAHSVIMQYRSLMDVYGKGERRREKFAVSTQHYSFAVKAFVEMVREYDVAQYEFALRETRTRQVIDDVAAARSEIGILYISDFNRRALGKLLKDNGLEFTHLITCSAFVYLWKGHPLAVRDALTLKDLEPYPCLCFEQGEDSSFYLAEEILSTNEYPRLIRCSDRATMLNLMVGLGGYTLCSGIICEELNGSDYRAVPYREDAENPNSRMDIGFITRKNALLSQPGEKYISELRRYLSADQNAREERRNLDSYAAE